MSTSEDQETLALYRSSGTPFKFAPHAPLYPAAWWGQGVIRTSKKEEGTPAPPLTTSHSYSSLDFYSTALPLLIMSSSLSSFHFNCFVLNLLITFSTCSPSFPSSFNFICSYLSSITKFLSKTKHGKNNCIILIKNKTGTVIWVTGSKERDFLLAWCMRRGVARQDEAGKSYRKR